MKAKTKTSKTAGRINLCTVTMRFAPEARGTNDISLEYGCVKDGLSVRACRYFKPMTCGGGLRCHGECEYFEYGCTCKRAIAAAKKRAEVILKVRMSK